MGKVERILIEDIQNECDLIALKLLSMERREKFSVKDIKIMYMNILSIKNRVSMLDTEQEMGSCKELADKISLAIELIENNAMQIALGEGMKKEEYKKLDRTGSKSPAYKSQASDSFIRERYLLGDTPDNIGSLCGVRGNTVRNRLKKMGIYNGRNNNEK